MPIETISSATGDIISLDDFQRELGIWDGMDDTRSQLLLDSARDYCERWGEVCLRLSATRTYADSYWPSDGWTLRHPPVTAVTSIVYRDTNNAEQTLATSNYQVNITEAGFAHIEYTPTADLPSLYDRQDAVKVTYTVGWTSIENAPSAAKYAIVMAARSLVDIDDVRLSQRCEEAAKSLLSTVSAPSYA